MSRPHYDAFQSLIPAGVRVFRGVAPIEPAASDYPYVVIGGDAGDEETETPAGEFDSLDVRYKLTYAGLTFDAVLVIVGLVRTAVRGKRLDVPGWSTGLMRPKALLPVAPDHDVTIPGTDANPFFCVDEVHVHSYR